MNPGVVVVSLLLVFRIQTQHIGHSRGLSGKIISEILISFLHLLPCERITRLVPGKRNDCIHQKGGADTQDSSREHHARNAGHLIGWMIVPVCTSRPACVQSRKTSRQPIIRFYDITSAYTVHYTRPNPSGIGIGNGNGNGLERTGATNTP